MGKTTRIRLSPGEESTRLSPRNNGQVVVSHEKSSPGSPHYRLIHKEREALEPGADGRIYEMSESVTHEHYERKRPKQKVKVVEAAHDDSHLYEEINRLREEIRQLLSRRNAEGDRNGALQGQLEALQAELDRMRAERDRLRGDMDRMRKQLDDDSRNSTRVHGDLQGARDRAKQEADDLRAEIDRLRDLVGDLRRQLADEQAKNAALDSQLRDRDNGHEQDRRKYDNEMEERDAQIRKLKGEVQALMLELQMLLDAKQQADKEIALYRKMLEGEEGNGLKQLVEQVVKSHSIQTVDDTETNRIVKGEIATRTCFQRSAKGSVAVTECEPLGAFVTIENTSGTKSEDISGWEIRRKIDSLSTLVFKLPARTMIAPGNKIKVCGRGNVVSGALVNSQVDDWGTGKVVQTSLYNGDGEERARHVQKETVTES